MAEKNRALEEAKAKAEQEKLFQEAQARRAAVRLDRSNRSDRSDGALRCS